MGLEKTTFVPTQANGRLTFRKSGDGLELQFVDSDNTVRDSAMLSEDDLRSLLKDNFPAKRKSKKDAAAATNGGRKRSGTTAGAAVST